MTITTAQLTEASLTGTGVFDVLMRAATAHLDDQFTKNRIKGPEYATVYLGIIDQVMQQALTFLLERDKSDLQAQLIQAQVTKTKSEVELVKQQTANAIIEGDNLTKQGCLLAAQYDLAMENKLKAVAETSLLTQKVITEKAQTIGSGVDADSVVGRQKALYLAQINGFQRDAEQKVAKLLADTWNVRRTTDEGTVADGTNMLNDATVGRAINKALEGVGA